MTHYLNDDVVDTAANVLKNNATRIVLCDGAPASFANANTLKGSGSGQKLAEASVTSSDLTIGNDATNGRRVTMAAKNNLDVLAAGDGTHIAWLDTANTRLLKVAPLAATLTGLTTLAKVNLPTHYHVFRDAEAVV